MEEKNKMNKNVLVFGIVALFFGSLMVTATDEKVDVDYLIKVCMKENTPTFTSVVSYNDGKVYDYCKKKILTELETKEEKKEIKIVEPVIIRTGHSHNNNHVTYCYYNRDTKKADDCYIKGEKVVDAVKIQSEKELRRIQTQKVFDEYNTWAEVLSALHKKR
jgi:hypothetical protein